MNLKYRTRTIEGWKAFRVVNDRLQHLYHAHEGSRYARMDDRQGQDRP